jgi:hypothetical protein
MVCIEFNMLSLQLKTFQVNLENESIKVYPIENISELNDLIRSYSRNIITQITFYFYDSNYKNHYLTLRNTEHNNDKFIVEFFHHYNNCFERIELSREEKIRDLNCVMNCLSNFNHLNNDLIPYIINPLNEFRTITPN